MAEKHRANLGVGLEKASGDRRLEKLLWLEVRVMLSKPFSVSSCPLWITHPTWWDTGVLFGLVLSWQPRLKFEAKCGCIVTSLGPGEYHLRCHQERIFLCI